jgi:TolA-binding protein
MMGELKFTAKKYDEAIPQFQRCMFGYGGDAATPEVKNWQGKSGYEAARCCEVQIESSNGAGRAKLIKDAQDFYKYVVEKHPKHELAAPAKKRLDELAKL